LVGTVAVSSYKVVVLGDIHGDYDALLAVLRVNGVLDADNNWVDETTKVISVGDTIGRGHQDRQVLEFIKAMTEQHQWLQNLGNHEIMQLRNDWRYAVDGAGIGFGSLANRQQALAVGSVLGDWLRSLPAIRQEADNLFIHAGLYDARNLGRSMSDLNNEIAQFIVQGQPRLVYDDLIWTRDLAYDAYANRPEACEFMARILQPFRAARLFIGHTPVQSLRGGNLPRPVDPLAFCGESLYDVDVGISRWMHSNPVNVLLEVDANTGTTTSIRTVYTAPLGEPLVNVTALLTEPETQLTEVA